MLSIYEKRKIAVLPLAEALKAAVSPDNKSKSSVIINIAEKYGFNPTTFANCLNPSTPSHTPNIHHLQAVLAETKDGRILDSLCDIHGKAAWFELPDVDVSAVNFLAHVGELGREMGDLTSSVCRAIEDGSICKHDRSVIQKDVFELIRVAVEILAMADLAMEKSHNE